HRAAAGVRPSWCVAGGASSGPDRATDSGHRHDHLPVLPLVDRQSRRARLWTLRRPPSAPNPLVLMTLLQRRLGVPGAVMVGMGSMLGAGVFVVFAPAAGAAGSGIGVFAALAI